MELANLPSDGEEWLRRLGWVQGLARALAGAEADDLAQEAVLRAARGERLPERSPAWWRTLTRHLHFERRRAEGRRVARERVAAERGKGWDEDTPDRIVARAEAQHAVARALFELDEDARQLLILRYYEDLAPSEIARRMGMEASTVRSRLQRARARLRGRLAREHGEGGLPALFCAAGAGGAAWSAAAAVLAAASVLVLATGAWLLARSGDPPPAAAAVEAAAASNHSTTALPASDGGAEPLIGALARGPIAPPDGGIQGNVVLTGRVVRDEDGGPIAGAVVATHSAPCHLPRPEPDCYWHQPIETVTDADGRFRFEFDPLQERFWIDVVADGRLLKYAMFERPPDAPVDLAEIPLQRGAVVEGIVLDEEGAPAVWAYVHLTGFPTAISGRPESNDVMYVQCEADGRFRMPYAIPPGTYPLDVRQDGLLLLDPPVLAVFDADLPVRLEIRVKRLPAVRGFVRDSNGDPVVNLRLSGNSGRRSGRILSAQTGPDGEFALFAATLEDLDAPCRMLCDDLEWWFASEPEPVPWGTEDVELRVLAAPALTLVVRDAEGRPVPEFDFDLRRPHPIHGDRISRREQGPFADGSARIPMKPGRNGIRVVPTDARWILPAPVWVDAADGEQERELVLEAAASVSLRVVDPEQRPVLEARVEMFLAGQRIEFLRDPMPDLRGPGNWEPGRRGLGGLAEAEGRTDADGRARLFAQPLAGDRWLRIHAPGAFTVVTLPDPETWSEEPVVVVQPAARFHGTLQSAWCATGEAQWIVVTAGEPADGSFTDRSKLQYLVPIAADGSFDQDGIVPGTYDLHLQLPYAEVHSISRMGFGSFTPNPAGGKVATVELRAGAAEPGAWTAPDHDPGVLAVTATLDGEAAAGYALEWILKSERMTGRAGMARLDADGSARLEQILPGEYELRLHEVDGQGRSLGEWNSGTIVRVEPLREISVAIAFGSRFLRLRFLRADGATPYDALMPAQLRGTWPGRHELADGWIELRGAPPPPWEFRVSTKDGADSWTVIVEAEPEESPVERVLIRPR
jgi:RNA polymerase sigma-70 factor (ECF subfamily)